MADKELPNLIEEDAPAAADILYLVTDPDGQAEDRKVSVDAILALHALDPTSAHESTAIAVDVAELSSDNVSDALVEVAGSVAAVSETVAQDLLETADGVGIKRDLSVSGFVSFDLDWLTETIFVEDFHTINTAAGGVGTPAWTVSETGGTVSDSGTTRGEVVLATGTGSGGTCSIEFPRNRAFEVANSDRYHSGWRVARSAASAGQAYLAEFGYRATAGSVAVKIRITGNASTVSVAAVTDDGSTEGTTALSTLAADTGAYFEILRSGTGEWQFYRDGSLVATRSTNTPPFLSAMRPFASILKTAGSGTSRLFSVDLFTYRQARV